ncbi:MAG: hypothetical protein QOJ14_668 [Thermoleophilaceae bacterium]|nr:hypothetical protein [Thermoleophilaceae bacterium]
MGERAGAYVIDWLLLAAITFGLYLLLTKSFPKEGYSNGIVIGNTRHAFESGSSNRAIWGILVLLAGLVIYVIAPGLTGRSPGKAATGIRVVRADGQPPGIGRALIRALLWIVDDFPYLILPLTGFIVALNSTGNRRVGDMAAGTWVVRADAAGQPVEPLLAQAAPAAVPPGGPPGGWQQPATAAPPQPGGGGGWQPPAPAAPSPAPTQPAGWYADPSGQARLRYWDGSAWTEHTAQ